MRFAALLGALFFLLSTPLVFAADSGGPNSKSAFLLPKLEELTRRSMKVIQENEGVVSVLLPDETSFAEGTQILFFRKKGIRVEVIATGKVLTEERDPKSNALLLKVDLDKDTVIKYPAVGDFATLLSDPSGAGEADKRDRSDFLLPEEQGLKPIDQRPGYLEVGLGLLYGDLSTTTTTLANNSKNSSSYRFGLIHAAYLSDYIPFGFEFDQHSGTFPTSTFYQTTVASREKITIFGLQYRFPPFFNRKIELSPKLTLLSDRFITGNTDENLLTTTTSGLGIGAKLAFNFIRQDWRPLKAEFPIKFQSLGVEATYFPSLTATDEGVSRGTESPGSSGYSARISATALAWFDFIPIFKRWMVQGSYGFRSYSLKFAGPTTPESVPTPLPIPENGSATERESDFRIFFGIRFDDPVKLFTRSKEKK
ncbi:MAG: hypothetical protein KGP28_12445 [Bdellovibrionales bacterium]|nr:hypothetical protein [Bdellovibrionales bacterium]